MDLATALTALVWLVDKRLVTLLPAGAPASELSELERLIGCPLPEDVRELYLRHDGLVNCLFSVAQIAEEWRFLRSVTLPGSAEFSLQPDYGVKPYWWTPRWIPVAGGGGEWTCIDMDPAVGGHLGQIVRVLYHDDPMRPQQGTSLRRHLVGFFSWEEWGLEREENATRK